jgi:hypothetical protein
MYFQRFFQVFLFYIVKKINTKRVLIRVTFISLGYNSCENIILNISGKSQIYSSMPYGE